MNASPRLRLRPAPADPWLVRPLLEQGEPRLRLFCFHCAGGAGTEFSPWPSTLPGGIEVAPVQLPGRENRFAEPPIEDLEVLVSAVLEGLGPRLRPPFALLGHCFGGLLAFELSRRLAALGRPAPEHLVVAGHRAPQLPQRNPRISHLDDRALVEELRRLGGTSEAVLGHKELLQLLLPPMRGDYRAAETYRYQKAPPLGCPILALGATSDPDTNEEELAAWASHTTGALSVRMLEGDHYFVTRRAPEVIALVTEALGATSR
jgi:medium-chain acyl-[acyl-carrier-protein] hydrolase